MRERPRIAVVGGGIAGLAAALRLRDLIPQAQVTVYEQGAALGGKLRTGALGGMTAEHGAEMFLARDTGDPAGGPSAAVALADRVGLAAELVHPRPVPAGLVLDGQLRPLPAGTLLGVPADPHLVAAVAPPGGDDRDGGRPLLAADQDVAVGDLIRRRFGDAVVDRLVDPMLGGVYAGRADALSLAATMPALARTCRTEHTLGAAVRAVLAAAPRPSGAPVFATPRGGVSQLVAAVAAASGARRCHGQPVRELIPAGAGWRLVIGSTRVPDVAAADAVVLALPSRPAAKLLRDVAPDAAAALAVLDYASVALVTLALPPVELPELSGFLVPATEGTAIKAATFLTRKWEHLGSDGLTLVRLSIGRHGEEQVLRHDDASLIKLAHRELSDVLHRSGHPLPDPVAAHVQRWGGALPQYPPGHLDRVAAARAVLPATLRLAGAGYDGIGIPVCVRSGETAAEQVAAALEESAV